MTASLETMREMLLPGLLEVTEDFYTDALLVKDYERYSVAFGQAVPHVSLPVAVAMGAAAVVMKNPVVKRRSLFMRILEVFIDED